MSKIIPSVAVEMNFRGLGARKIAEHFDVNLDDVFIFFRKRGIKIRKKPWRSKISKECQEFFKGRSASQEFADSYNEWVRKGRDE